MKRKRRGKPIHPTNYINKRTSLIRLLDLLIALEIESSDLFWSEVTEGFDRINRTKK